MLRKKKVRDKMSKKGFDNTDTKVRKQKERNEDRKKIVRKKRIRCHAVLPTIFIQLTLSLLSSYQRCWNYWNYCICLYTRALRKSRNGSYRFERKIINSISSLDK